MKLHILRLSAGILACLLLLSGCGNSSQSSSSTAANSEFDYSSNGALEEEYTQDMASTDHSNRLTGGPSEEVSFPALPEDGRKRIQYVTLSLEATDFDAALTNLIQAVTQAGGYLADQRVDGRSIHAGEYYQRTATLSARVPVDQLDEVVQQAGDICNITSTRSSVEDITDQYVDTETRLETLRLQETRLMELMAQAQNMEDLLVIEERLSQVQYEIESLTGQKQKMDQQVAYSYLTLDLEEVVQYQKTQNQPATFVEKLRVSLNRSGRNIANSLEGLLFLLIEDGPLWLIYGGIIFLLVLLFRKTGKIWSSKHPRSSVRPDAPRTGGWGYPPVNTTPPTEPTADTPPKPPTE